MTVTLPSLPAEQKDAFLRLQRASHWCAELLQSRPSISTLLFDVNSTLNIFRTPTYTDLAHFLDTHIAKSNNFDQALREARQIFMCQVIWRDANGLLSVPECCEVLSFFAELCIQACLKKHSDALYARYGKPRNKQGELQGMLVLGMGKLGAWELNLSSDIDLVFCYPENGETDALVEQISEEQKSDEQISEEVKSDEKKTDKKSLSNQAFFVRLGQKIIQSLDTITADGRVFRVDMRLRPYGGSGELVSNFAALEDYYQTQGREWERYAMVKARVVACTANADHSQQLMHLLRNFTYRKYVDFSAIAALRKLKDLINQEVKRRQLDNNIKLGPGGIREIEFIAQVFQLIRGGRDTELQDNRLRIILPELEAMECLPKDMANDLWQAYEFLRRCEHALQAWKDEQTHELPRDPEAQLRLATVLGFTTWEDFFLQLEAHRHLVHAEFQEVISPPADNARGGENHFSEWHALWLGQLDDEASLALLSAHMHENSERSLQILEALRQSSTIAKLHASGRERLDDFMPRLLAAIAETASPTETLFRISKLVQAIVRRSAYLVLLVENPKALAQLVTLSVASPWIPEQLTRHPALLDELLDPRTLYHAPDLDELGAELRQHMLRVPEDDLEAQMEALRYFRSAHALRVAACEISETLPLMKVSDYLSWLAEVILQYVYNWVKTDMALRYGTPDGKDELDFIIVAYGKLGGIELGHGSDLDLVFIYDADPNGQSSGNQANGNTETGKNDGKRQLDNAVYCMRLGQKIIHLLNTNTAGGQLYEVDMRLRPSGNSGLLVSSLRAFEKYQENSAWTWEHQALVRARVVAGSDKLSAQFMTLREQILRRQRNLDRLREEVVAMRQKMRDQLGSDKLDDGSQPFHLKQDAGGIVDIEFLVQFAVLAWSHTHPELCRYTDNIRILEQLAATQCLSTEGVETLTRAYKTYRALGHRLTLQQKDNLLDAGAFLAERQAVKTLWQKVLL